VSLGTLALVHLFGLPLITTYYQPYLDLGTGIAVVLTILGTYAGLITKTPEARKEFLNPARWLFGVALSLCVLIRFLLNRGWAIPTDVVDVLNYLQIGTYIAAFCAYSAGVTYLLLSEGEHAKKVILFLSANPRNIGLDLRLDKEVRTIDEALTKAKFRDFFKLELHSAVRVADLQGLLSRHKPHLVHFSGHGEPSSEIVLEDEHGNGRPVPVDALHHLFSLLKHNLRCVVLNACYSEDQARAIATEVDCVVGMSIEIGDDAAIAFSSAFYETIGDGKDIQTAFELGCGRIQLERLAGHSTPRLVSLKADPNQIVLVDQP
jgi:hypothetical protein